MNYRDSNIVHSAALSLAVEAVCVVGIFIIGLILWGV